MDQPTDLGTRSNYGFTVKYLKNGSIQGNSLYIYRVSLAAGDPHNVPDGEHNWIIKNNAMGRSRSGATAPRRGCAPPASPVRTTSLR